MCEYVFALLKFLYIFTKQFVLLRLITEIKYDDISLHKTGYVEWLMTENVYSQIIAYVAEHEGDKYLKNRNNFQTQTMIT